MYSYNSFLYSLDKIKIKGKLKTNKHSWIPNQTKVSYWVQFKLPDWCECIQEAECLHPFKYRYMFCLRVKGDKEGTFTIFEWYNGDYKESKQKPDSFIIEYNPNKSGQRIYEWFCNCFIFKFTEIISFDIAYDIQGYSPEDVLLDTSCDVMTYGKTSNKTLYIAPKEDRSGRVKVYAKDKERQSKGNDELLDKLLRIECSIKCSGLDFSTIHINGKTEEELSKCVRHLNSVKIKSASQSAADWKLLALMNVPPDILQQCLSNMAEATRVRYKKLLTSDTYFSLDLDIPTLLQHITQLTKPYSERIKVK